MEKALEKILQMEGGLTRYAIGHGKGHRNAAMTGYLSGHRKNVGDIFNVKELGRHLKKAYRLMVEIKKSGGIVLFVAKDKSHYNLLQPLWKAIEKEENKSNPILLEKWTPGLLTQNKIQSGVGLVITFGNKLLPQIKREGYIKRVPIMSVIDSDKDPRGVSYIIPCNDESYKGLYLLSRVLLDVYLDQNKGK